MHSKLHLIFGRKRGKILQNPILTVVVYTIFALNLNTNQQITCNFNLFIQKPSSLWRQQPSPTGGTTVLLFTKAVPSLSPCFDHKGRRLEHRAPALFQRLVQPRWKKGRGGAQDLYCHGNCKGNAVPPGLVGAAQMRASVNSSWNTEYIFS